MRTCTYDDCDRKHYAKDLCRTHYKQLNERGTLKPIRARYGEGTPTVDGYVKVVMVGRTYLAHRLVMQGILGRELFPDEVVHHKDGDRSNNHPANLELWYKSQPSGQRVSDLIEYIAKYHPLEMRKALDL